jgi:hypothetical protein
MRSIRARVSNGRIVVDQATTLPEGTILDLVLDDEGDDLSPEERRTLNAALERSWEAARKGLLRPGAEVLSDLRNRG